MGDHPGPSSAFTVTVCSSDMDVGQFALAALEPGLFPNIFHLALKI